MPPFVIPDTVQVVLTWDFNGQPWAQNVLHYEVDVLATVNQDVADSVDADVKAKFVSSGLASRVSNLVSLGRVSIRDIRQANLPMFVGTGGVQAGTNVNNALPMQNAVVVTLRTDKAGQSYRGRVYLTGFTENDNTAAGLVSTALATDCEDFITSLGTISDTTPPYEIRLGVASRTLLETNLVRGAVVRDSVWDIQRRRKDPIIGS